jgi:thiol-disulfide isomerase/thioredoxin
MMTYKVQGYIGWLLLIITSLAGGAQAETLDVELESGAVITTERFGSGQTRILWLPSEYGMAGRNTRELARQVAGEGLEVWLADLHTSYFLPPGRSSFEKIPVEDIRDLIAAAQPGQGQLYLLSYGRGAALFLEAARLWQLQAEEQDRPLGGALLFHPNLMAGTAKAGEPARFAPIAGGTNLPLFIFQPMNSAKRWYLEELVAELRRGSSDIYYRPLANVSDGFQVRDDAGEAGLEMRKHIPAMVRTAIRLLQPYNRERRQPVAELPESGKPAAVRVAAGLQPLEGRPEAPKLSLTDIDGRHWSLEELRGEAVLVNFWATWCPPCVEEIPALGRLNKRMADRPFRVISVDVGQEEAEVRRFLEEVPADFPVLLDPQGSVTDPWQIRAFPTSFLIDREGRMRYGYFGALAWDSDEVVEVIGSVLDD